MSLHRPGFDIVFRTKGYFDWGDGFGMWGGKDSTNRMVGLNMIHVFDTPGPSMLTIPRRMKVRYLVVAGGGIRPGHVVEGTATLNPGQYAIEVGDRRQQSRLSTVIADPRDVSVQTSSITPVMGHDSNIDGRWTRYATETTPTEYGGVTRGGTGTPGCVIIRYSVQDILNEYIETLRRRAMAQSSTHNDDVVRRIHAIQSVMTPPYRVDLGPIDELIRMAETLYTSSVSKIDEMSRQGLDIEARSIQRDAQQYRAIRQTLVDAKDGVGLMYHPQDLIRLLKERQVDDDITYLENLESTCPEHLVEGHLVVDGKDGTLYMFQANALRHIPFDMFRRMSDTRYTMFPEGYLDSCQRRPSTSIIPQRTLTTTEILDDQTPIFEPALFTITHQLSKKALTRRGFEIKAESIANVPTEAKHQQWKISGGGYIQSASGGPHEKGTYLSPLPDCTGVIGTTDPAAPWNIIRLGNATLELQLPCGSYLTVDPVDHVVTTVPSSSDLTRWTIAYTGPTSGYIAEKNVKIF